MCRIISCVIVCILYLRDHQGEWRENQLLWLSDEHGWQWGKVPLLCLWQQSTKREASHQQPIRRVQVSQLGMAMRMREHTNVRICVTCACQNLHSYVTHRKRVQKRVKMREKKCSKRVQNGVIFCFICAICACMSKIGAWPSL